MPVRRKDDEPRSIYPTFETTMAPFRDIVSMRELGLALRVQTLIKEGPRTLTAEEFEDSFGLSGFVLEGANLVLGGVVYKSSSEYLDLKNGNGISIHRKVGGNISRGGVINWDSYIDVSTGSRRKGESELRYEVKTAITGVVNAAGPQVDQLVHTVSDYPTSISDEQADYVPGKIFVAGRQRNGSYRTFATTAHEIKNPWSDRIKSLVDPDLLRTIIDRTHHE